MEGRDWLRTDTAYHEDDAKPRLCPGNLIRVEERDEDEEDLEDDGGDQAGHIMPKVVAIVRLEGRHLVKALRIVENQFSVVGLSSAFFPSSQVACRRLGFSAYLIAKLGLPQVSVTDGQE